MVKYGGNSMAKSIESEIFNVKEAAPFLGINHVTMSRIVQQNDFPAFRIGRRWMIPREALMRWIEEQAARRAKL